MSKTRAAKIANSGKAGSRKGGKHSHRGSNGTNRGQTKVFVPDPDNFGLTPV